MNYIVEQTEAFAKWHSALRDLRAKITISRRIDRAENGNLGDVKPVGGDVSEMCGGVVVVLLVGGDKSTQQADIKCAIELAKEI